MSIVTVNYDSVAAFVADMTDTSRRPPEGVREHHNESGGDRMEFTWTKTWEEAVALQRKGWQEGADRVQRHRDGLQAFVAAAKAAKSLTTTWDFSGVWYDAAKDLSGDPECWACEQFVGDSIANRVVSVRLNNCVSCGITANTITARGLALLVAVDLLEACGTRVEVIIGQASRQNGTVVECNITAKRADENADPNGIAFSVSHPAFFRRFGFRFLELHGQTASICIPCPMSDAGQRQGVIEIDEILSKTRLSDESVKAQVLKVAAACGLTFSDEQMQELIAG
jgi:hypothetical protein